MEKIVTNQKSIEHGYLSYSKIHEIKQTIKSLTQDFHDLVDEARDEFSELQDEFSIGFTEEIDSQNSEFASQASKKEFTLAIFFVNARNNFE